MEAKTLKIDPYGDRVGKKDLLAIMLAQSLVLVPVILVLGISLGAVLWVMMRFWNI